MASSREHSIVNGLVHYESSVSRLFLFHAVKSPERRSGGHELKVLSSGNQLFLLYYMLVAISFVFVRECILYFYFDLFSTIIHQTHYEKSDWSRAFNQFTIACELDMINAISAADIAFTMSSSTSSWLLSPLECSPQKQNGWTLRFCFWGWIGLLQQTITWYKIRHTGGQAHYYSRTGTLKQRDLN